MSNSATSSAKRRRAAPFLTSQAFQPNFSAEQAKTQYQPQQQPQQQASNPQINPNPEQKMLTLQQVISLVDSRITNLEKNIIEIKSEARDGNDVNKSSDLEENDIKPLVETIMFEFLSEFNERYEILAGEILELKNIVIGLQSYTMNVNKVLLEDRMKSMAEESGGRDDQLSGTFAGESDNSDSRQETVFAEMHCQTEGYYIENQHPDGLNTSSSNDEENVISEEDRGNEGDNVQKLEEHEEITIVAKSQKKRGSNKKSQVILEQE
jgi:hypothetical protein